MNGTETQSVQALAKVAAQCFETAVRPEGPEFFRLTEGSPEWVSDLVRDAHGTDADGSPAMLPDDWRYACVSAACEWIAENENGETYAGVEEFADQYVDTYTGDRLAWLASHLSRPAYCDEARAEYGTTGGDGIVELIGLGQYMEASEVYGLVLESLRARVGEVAS